MQKLDRRIIRRMILEEAKVMKQQKLIAESNVRIAKYCAKKERKMLREGYSRIEINESILGDLFGLGKDTVMGAPGGFLESIEQMIITKLLKTLFGENYDPDSFVGAVITNVIENIDVMEIGKYFGEGACDPIVETLYKGISEAITEQGMNKLFGDRDDAGYLASMMRESFTNAINDTAFQQSMKQGIKDVVCSIDYSSIMGSMMDKLRNLGGSIFGGSSSPA